jgi:hypothetical protein
MDTYDPAKPGTVLTIRVPSGAVSAYTAVWGVYADALVNENRTAYGYVHKAIVITDTPAP